jgi:hypothetical protein
MGQTMPTLTVGEVTYENASLKKEYPRSFFIQHDGGTAFIDKSKLSEEQTEELLQATSQPESAAPGESAETESKPKESPGASKQALPDSAEGLFIQPTPETLDNDEQRKFIEACGKPDTQTILALLEKNPDLAKINLKGQTYKRILPEKVNGEWVDTTIRYLQVESTHSPLQWLIDKSEKTPERIDTIKALVDAGADMNAETSERGTNCARNVITDPAKLLPEELDYLLGKGADPYFGWCVGNTMPVMNLTLSYLGEKDPQKRTELATLLRVYAKHKVDLSKEGGSWGTGQMGGKLAEAGSVNSAKQVIELSQDQELAAIFAGN